MKTLLKNSLTFLLMLMPVLAFAQQAPQIMNVSARQTTSLDGQWKTIVLFCQSSSAQGSSAVR